MSGDFKRITLPTSLGFDVNWRDIEQRYELAIVMKQGTLAAISAYPLQDMAALIKDLEQYTVGYCQSNCELADALLAEAITVWERASDVDDRLPAKFIDHIVVSMGQRIEFGYYEKEPYAS